MNKSVMFSFFGNEKFPVEWESEDEKKLHFWFDDAHTPHPLTPLYGSIHNAMAWEVTCTYGLSKLALPSTKGVKAKLVNGYVYPAMVPTTEEEAKKLAPIHNLVLPFYLKNVPRLWKER
ncbi:MAG: PEP-utilizing protein mobile subunit, partial [Candidatus Bathyarchaeia archaeon]